MAEQSDAWWTSKEVAAYYKIPLETLRYWRKQGKGPAGTKVGTHVRYPLSEIRRYDRELMRGAA